MRMGMNIKYDKDFLIQKISKVAGADSPRMSIKIYSYTCYEQL